MIWHKYSIEMFKVWDCVDEPPRWGTENRYYRDKKELTDDNVYKLLHYATNKEEIATILGTDNINKLTNDDVFNLLVYAEYKASLATILLGTDNVNKLNDDDVYKNFSNESNP